MKHLRIYITLSLILCFGAISAQEVKLLRRKSKAFYEEYYVLKKDTSIKHGRYFRKYKNLMIEHGHYKQGEKQGKWIYFTLDGVFEFEYDYSIKKVTKIANRQKPEEYFETPVFFDGSPIIPYLYIVSHIRYPKEAKELNINGKVTLAINVDQNGKPTQLFIKEKLHHLLDKEVIKVAKTFPRHWKWIPATYNGQNVSSEYHIDVEFELIE